MKKYVWSATLVEGGKPFSGVAGASALEYRRLPEQGIHDQLTPGAAAAPQFYADSVVVAYKRTSVDRPVEELQAKITASGNSFDAAMLTDGDLEKTTKIPIPAMGQSSWIQYEFPSPQTIRAITFVTKDPDFIAALIAGMGAPEKNLEASDDGQNFREVAKLDRWRCARAYDFISRGNGEVFPRDLQTRRLLLPFPPGRRVLTLLHSGSRFRRKPTDYEIAELVLHPAPA